jgi:lysophospholipase L1-like esterase
MRLFFFLALFSIASCATLPEKYIAGKAEWESSIQELEARDQQESYPDDAILFVGSSSIRLWSTIATDMAPYVPIQRGYGGARFTDMIHFTERLVAPHQVQAVVCFVANDIAGDPARDISPKEVLKVFRYFVRQVRDIHPNVPIFQIAITPTPSRWAHYSRIAEANELMKEYCEKTDNLFFINTVPAYLDVQGQPRPELFVKDMLHLNRAGYDLWRDQIKPVLDAKLQR